VHAKSLVIILLFSLIYYRYDLLVAVRYDISYLYYFIKHKAKKKKTHAINEVTEVKTWANIVILNYIRSRNRILRKIFLHKKDEVTGEE
jgi:hypothetical protein